MGGGTGQAHVRDTTTRSRRTAATVVVVLAFALLVGALGTGRGGPLLAFLVPALCFVVVGACLDILAAIALSVLVGIAGPFVATWVGAGPDGPMAGWAHVFPLFIVPLLIGGSAVGLLVRVGLEAHRLRTRAGAER